MAGVDIHGRDAAAEAYIIRTADGAALLPEHLMHSALRPGARPSHQDAYEWIAAHSAPLSRALRRLTQGQRPARPYDSLTLLGASSLQKYAKTRAFASADISPSIAQPLTGADRCP